MSEPKLAPDASEIATPALEELDVAFRSSASEEEALTYWRKQLAGLPPILEMPTDRPRPSVQSLRGARLDFCLSGGMHNSLTALGQQEEVPLFVVLLAAFHTMLARYTRQDDIVTGAILPLGDDSRADVIAEKGVALPVRTDTSADPTFREMLTRVCEIVRLARENQEFRWERLVEAVQPESDPSRHPIYQIVFSFETSGFEDDATDGAPLNFDLQLQLSETATGVAARFTYSTDLFDRTTIVRMAGHLQRLLEAIVENPDTQILRLPLLTEAERHKLMIEWNDRWTDYPRQVCLHEMFQAQVERTPKGTAVLFEGKQLTYSELNRRSNQLAHHLVKLGVGPSVLVGICVERSPDMIVGLLGILKAGGAYVPVDPAFPADRIAFMLEDAEAPVLLTQQSLVSTLPKSKAALVRLDQDWPTIANESSENLPAQSKAEDLAYTMYTSGSTGKPKGVQILHRAVVNFLLSMAKEPGMTSEDRLLAVTTLSFDIAGLEIYLPLILGASVEIVSREVYSDGKRLLAQLKNSGASVMQATPATWRMLLDAGWQSSPGLKILVGGEAVPAKLASQLMERAASVWNVYGPTETTIWSTVRKFVPGEASVSIGRPIANTEIFIVDKLMQPVPIGVAGELLIGGDGLARGYFKRPELTTEKFIPHPFRQDTGARLYRTGDLARYLPNGNIEFLGRIDHQIKIRGFRIELGEIEAVLRQHAGVKETVVVAREDVPGDPRLVAYVIPADAQSCSVAELRTHIRERLPKYMLPAAFVMLEQMPLTPNGKVNRRALPAPAVSEFTAGEDLVEPRTPTERQLVDIWENILGVRPIGVTHDFFDLGGHSLLAVRLMSRIQEAFGQNLPVATLLEARTVEKLAEVLKAGWSSPWSSLVQIQHGGTKAPLFCVHGAGGVVVRFQELAKHLGPDQPVYGVQARGLDGKEACDANVEAMATRYLEEIRSVQPQGPYLFAGYSMGGLIAIEMAQKLIAEGQEQVSVILFDTFCPAGANGAKAQNGANCFAQALASGWQKWARTSVPEKWEMIARVATTAKDGIHRRVSHMFIPRSLKNVRRTCEKAARNYVPRVYPGRLILFRSLHRPLLQFSDPHLGWRSYAEGLEIHEIDGNHDSILLEPQVRRVASELKNYLNVGTTTN